MQLDLGLSSFTGFPRDYNAELQNLVTAKMPVVLTDTALWKDGGTLLAFMRC